MTDTPTEDDLLAEIQRQMISDLEDAGLKCKLPDRQPGQYTISELCEFGGFSRDAKKTRKAVDGLVRAGKWKRSEVVIREGGRVYHSTVYERIKSPG